ncbi:unnamed protein product [Caenorhabditis auriculariae]|uniref:Uncharacterized protein n=1 Tax=Caenorhabditis auriculariae TaxID=2777116 RepID=A0A8S1HZ09_9PELO|nr:unnamed protein product [Caenorhabditis auriculariae]
MERDGNKCMDACGGRCLLNGGWQWMGATMTTGRPIDSLCSCSYHNTDLWPVHHLDHIDISFFGSKNPL